MSATDIPSNQPALDPTKLHEEGMMGVHENWRHAMHLHALHEGGGISCINGRPDSKWSFRAEGPAAFSINILLEGRIQTALDDGSVLDAGAGSTILLTSAQHTPGWDVLDGKSDGAFRMASIHMSQAAMNNLIGLSMDDLRSRSRIVGDQPHLNAFLGFMPASSRLQRLASDLLRLSSHSGPESDIARNLYLRAKTFEALGCFVQENLTQQEIALPVPSDRNRLHEARGLLERSYGDDWSVQTLARAVGLNEKRLQAGFQALYGSSVHTCLTHIRINAAITLLQRGVSVTETAFSCGFSSLSHFSRAFRSHTGISPKQCALGSSPASLSMRNR